MTKEDAISRQAAIDALKHLSKNYAGIGKREYHPHIDFVIDVITMLPSVSTEKTGRWIFVQYDFDPRIGNWHCSKCRNIVYQGVEKKGIHNEVIYNFCPWCGAKMEVEE